MDISKVNLSRNQQLCSTDIPKFHRVGREFKDPTYWGPFSDEKYLSGMTDIVFSRMEPSPRSSAMPCTSFSGVPPLASSPTMPPGLLPAHLLWVIPPQSFL